jgi:hypothetical protein
MRFVISVFAFVVSATLVFGQSAPSESPMTGTRLIEIIREIDADAKVISNTAELTIEDVPILIVISEPADRMRAMVPISSAEGLSPQEMLRVLQANFDSALDARYAIAQGKLWSVYIHPLSALEQDQFLSGLVQTINVARTYGQSYSGGATVFGGGDSNGIYQELLEKLQKKGQAL